MFLEKIRHKNILVVGMARSGVAATRFLLDLGAHEVIANDFNHINNLEAEAKELEKIPQVKMVTGGHPLELITDDLSLVVKSPGVPPDLKIFQEARMKKIPVISEIELAYPFIKAPIIGITGTNGKTTTTNLVAEILQEGEINKVFKAGNIGNPLVDVAGKATAGDMVVAELSSFQLDDIAYFRPFISVILNIKDDHLNYHGDRNNYIRAKSKILANQGGSDIAILNADDELVISLKEKVSATPLFFSNEQLVEGFCLKDNCLGLYQNGKFRVICEEKELPMPGKHNRENALAAAAAAWGAGVNLDTIGRGLHSFKGVEHRLELACEIDGVTFVNDSKGTNPEASEKALEAFPGQNKIMIAGGKDKKADFQRLAHSIANNQVELLILLGETAFQIKETVAQLGFDQVEIVNSLEEAVVRSWQHSKPGDVVLFSPACASWDMFKDYEERGRSFKENVKMLPTKHD